MRGFVSQMVLCDGISFQNDMIEQVSPLTRIIVRFDRIRCTMEISTKKSIIGILHGVSGNDLRFFCFTVGRGCWTISSSSQNRNLEAGTLYDLPYPFLRHADPFCQAASKVDLGRIGLINFEESEPIRLMAPQKPSPHYHSCQNLLSEAIPTSPLLFNSSLEFDCDDASNTASVCKLSMGDRTNRLLCDFFSDYGRGYGRVQVSAVGERLAHAAAFRLKGADRDRRELVTSQESFPSEGQLFVDCLPIHQVCILACPRSPIAAVTVSLSAEIISDPALNLLQCSCQRRARIPRSTMVAGTAAVNMATPRPQLRRTSTSRMVNDNIEALVV
jgi:hypothetical protein